MQEYNKVYNKFVQDDKDFYGLVAYSLYKDNKVKFINELKKKKTVDSSINKQLLTFQDYSIENKEKYKQDAIKLIKIMTANNEKEFVDKVEAKAKEGAELGAINTKETFKTFSWGVLESLIGSIVLLVITLFIIFNVYVKNNGGVKGVLLEILKEEPTVNTLKKDKQEQAILIEELQKKVEKQRDIIKKNKVN